MLAPRDRKMILGITGSGKSHYVRHTLLPSIPRFFAFDPYGEIEGPGAVHVSLGQLADDHLLLEREERVVLVPQGWDDPESLGHQFVAYSTLAQMVRDRALIIEEIGALPDSGKSKAKERLSYLATQARHWGMPIVMVAQAATMIPKHARRQVRSFVSFLQVDPDDIAALRQIAGPDVADKIATLPEHEFVTWSVEDAFQKNKNRRKKK